MPTIRQSPLTQPHASSALEGQNRFYIPRRCTDVHRISLPSISISASTIEHQGRQNIIHHTKSKTRFSKHTNICQLLLNFVICSIVTVETAVSVPKYQHTSPLHVSNQLPFPFVPKALVGECSLKAFWSSGPGEEKVQHRNHENSPLGREKRVEKSRKQIGPWGYISRRKGQLPRSSALRKVKNSVLRLHVRFLAAGGA